MDTAKLNDWMQVVGIFAVVASLVFVGIQMRQDHRIARVMIYQSRASTLAEISMTAAASPDSMAALIKSRFGDPDQMISMEDWAAPITAQDMMLGSFQVTAFLAIADNSFFQYQEGFLPEDHWESVRATLVNIVTLSPFMRFRMEAILDLQRPAFRDELIGILRAADDESTN